jgi:hypothetical protein
VAAIHDNQAVLMQHLDNVEKADQGLANGSTHHCTSWWLSSTSASAAGLFANAMAICMRATSCAGGSSGCHSIASSSMRICAGSMS